MTQRLPQQNALTPYVAHSDAQPPVIIVQHNDLPAVVERFGVPQGRLAHREECKLFVKEKAL